MSAIKKEKSLVVFESFVLSDENGVVNVKELFSKECFNYWLETRSNIPKNPPEAFRKALTSHCAGVDGRKPFSPLIEEALLVELRKKRVWKCFEGTKAKVGLRGLQVKGYWERDFYKDIFPQKSTVKKKKRKLSCVITNEVKNENEPKIKVIKTEIKQKVEHYPFYNNNVLLLPLPDVLCDNYENFYVDPFEELLNDSLYL